MVSQQGGGRTRQFSPRGSTLNLSAMLTSLPHPTPPHPMLLLSILGFGFLWGMLQSSVTLWVEGWVSHHWWSFACWTYLRKRQIVEQEHGQWRLWIPADWESKLSFLLLVETPKIKGPVHIILLMWLRRVWGRARAEQGAIHGSTDLLVPCFSMGPQPSLCKPLEGGFIHLGPDWSGVRVAGRGGLRSWGRSLQQRQAIPRKDESQLQGHLLHCKLLLSNANPQNHFLGLTLFFALLQVTKYIS